jgi:hypothetical protein
MLFSTPEIKAGFPNCETIELAEMEVELHERLFHNAKGSMIRFIGRKKIDGYCYIWKMAV